MGALHTGSDSEIIITVRGGVVHKGVSKVKSHRQKRQKRQTEREEKHKRVVTEEESFRKHRDG